jgi:uncharacterized protein
LAERPIAGEKILRPRLFVSAVMEQDMREQIEGALKQATLDHDRRRINTLRLIKTTIRDRDSAAKNAGGEGVSEDEVFQILLKMIKQRLESAKFYGRNGRDDLATEEMEEIEIIKSLLPKQLTETEIQNVCAEAIRETDSHGLRDLGKCMQALKHRYPSQMDFGKAIQIVKQRLQ